MNSLVKIVRKIARELLLKWRCESRYILERKIFPRIKRKNILFVGVADYTSDYPRRLRENNLWTIDIDPKISQFGSKKHIIGSIADINKYFPENYFNIIFLFGVFGFGLNTADEAEKTLKNCYKVLKQNGLLMIQWTDKEGKNPINPKNLKNFKLFKEISLFGYASGYRTSNKGVLNFLIKSS